ncbi:MAG TPA: NAD(P)H-dependent oxidoreductase subunit E [Candidatus Atribacteria bacterium]|nr:NAD(P)H-dependent oxidoreductase subunit E [Candidatus Atribacteria bacterium]
MYSFLERIKMVTVSICVGSSCHLKGAYEIIEICEELIEKLGLRDQIELKGNFCLGRCAEKGVTVMVDGEILSGVSPQNFRKIFEEKILKKLGEGNANGSD